MVDLQSAISLQISTDISQLTAGMNQATSLVGRFADGTRRVGSQMTILGGQISLLTAPIMAIGTAGIDTASAFQDVVNELATFGGLAGAELDTVRQAALRMGADTMFSATDAASAMLELVKAGQSVEQALTSADAVLELAAVGGMGMAEAAGVMSSALAIFGLHAEDAGLVSDALARAASASRADVRGLGEALSNVGGIARVFGLGIDQTVAALGVFENAGISGAAAGTQLKSVLMNLSRTTPDVTAAWRDLGVSLYNAQGDMRDFDAIIDDLSAALSGMSDADTNYYLSTLGGSYGIVGLQALIAAGGIDTMMAAMEGSPAASELAAAAMGTFSGRIENLKGGIETLIITALTPFMEDVLTPLVDKLADVAGRVADWAGANPELTAQIVGLLAGAVMLGPALVGLGTALKVLMIPLGVVSTLFGIITSPIGLVVAGFAAVLALGGQLTPLFEGLRDILGQGLQDALFGLSTAFNQITSGQTELGLMTLGVSLNVIKDALGAAAQLTLDSLVKSLENITGLDISGGLGQLGEMLTTIGGLADQFVIQPIVDGLRGLAEGVQSFIDTLTSEVDPAAVQGIVDFVAQLGGAVAALVGGLIAVAGELVGETLGAIGEALPGIASGIADFVNALGGLLNGDLDAGEFLSGIGDGFLKLGESLLSIPVGAADGLIEMINGALGIDIPSVTAIFDTLNAEVITPVREAFEGFVGVLEGAWALIGPPLQDMADWFLSTFLTIDSSAVAPLQSGFEELQRILAGIWEAVRPFVEALGNGISAALQPARDIIDAITAGLASLQGMGGLTAEMRGAADASGMTEEQKWQVALDAAGGVDWLARIAYSQIQGRAVGGPVLAGNPYIVGERGPEMFVPSSSGRIIPNGAGAGGGGGQTVNITINAYGSAPHEFAGLVKRALRDSGI